MLQGSVLGELCLLNTGKCLAAAYILEEIADTALPDAVRASELAGIFVTASFSWRFPATVGGVVL